MLFITHSDKQEQERTGVFESMASAQITSIRAQLHMDDIVVDHRIHCMTSNTTFTQSVDHGRRDRT